MSTPSPINYTPIQEVIIQYKPTYTQNAMIVYQELSGREPYYVETVLTSYGSLDSRLGTNLGAR